eukprot:GHVN01031555.1.p1 GENE.GHVN01031555.1~~GHVN01031555.1.p1  ORF type:complete len:122 (-),score=1.64 GHVN01031555.1:1246-1611(-)
MRQTCPPPPSLDSGGDHTAVQLNLHPKDLPLKHFPGNVDVHVGRSMENTPSKCDGRQFCHRGRGQASYGSLARGATSRPPAHNNRSQHWNRTRKFKFYSVRVGPPCIRSNPRGKIVDHQSP